MSFNKRPVTFVSFQDLKSLGYNVYVTEHEKEKPSGELTTAVKVVKVEHDNGKDVSVVPKSYMMELLYILGIDTRDPNLHVWVTPKKIHRCLGQKEPAYDYRYSGYERLDKEYLLSGRASEEAIMYGSGMDDMHQIAYEMKHGGER